MNEISNEITLTWENINVLGPDQNTCVTKLLKKPFVERKNIIQNGNKPILIRLFFIIVFFKLMELLSLVNC